MQITTQQDLINRVNNNIKKAQELQEMANYDKSLLFERKMSSLTSGIRERNNKRIQMIQESINRTNTRINIALNEGITLEEAKDLVKDIDTSIEKAKEEKLSEGTYVGVNYTQASVDELQYITKLLGLEKDFDDQYHTTIAYSKRMFTFFPYTCGSKRRKVKFVPGNMNKVKIKDIGHFNTPEGKNLHIVLDAPFCDMEHKRTLRAGAQYDHDKYIPHITLMYNCKDFDINTFKKENAETYHKIIGTHLVLKDEYVEKLDPNWTNKINDK